MKNISLIIIFTLISFGGFAQSATTSFDVDGIKVILKPTSKEVVSVNLYYRGGVSNYSAAKAGIENLALSATAECGTKNYTKDSFKDKEDAFGINVSGSSTYDYGVISLSCITKYFNEGWDLFKDAVVNPAFEEKEFALLKGKLISGLRQAESDPDSRIAEMAIKNTFIGTVYATDPKGDTLSLAKLQQADVKDYYNQLLNKSRMYIVAVGNITKDDLTKKIHEAFAQINAKPVTFPTYQTPIILGSKLFVEERQLATNYIEGILNAPQMSDLDYAAHRLAYRALSERLFTEIRTKRNLSYAPQAGVRVLKMPSSIVYVSTTDPKASVQVIADELNKIKTAGFSVEDFKGAKGSFLTSNYMREESSSAIASSLGLAEALGSWKLAEELPAKLNMVTQKEMNDAFNKYTTGIIWNYLGTKSLADEANSSFNIQLKK